MKGTTYNQLQVFQAIVLEGSIRGAARKLEMAAPSVSQSLKLLEENIGLTLFNRTTRKIELTDAGRQLHERTQAAMESLTYAVESVQELTEEPSGHLRITVPKFVYNTYLKAIFADFCRQYPQIELELSISDATLDIVKEGIDLGIRFGNILEQGMVAKKLTEPMKEALFASPDYLQKFGTPQSLQDLSRHKLIQYRFITSNKYAQLNLTENGQQVRVEIPYALVVNDTDLMIDAAKEGLGIGRLVAPALNTEFKSGQLLPVLEDKWTTYPGLYLYFTQNSQRVKRVRVFIDYLTERFT
ncbi:LysR family transcriptional regulator [Vibrio sinaloensis]|uniref:LysR family transcriptional regulator n=1 Tax=Photobacterium sp. (strain ATCC 43367) TaxID=379097 RepID=UPI0020583E50|nr:LysR family transcriptional regulator [Vibrio sinaloensis]UPQ88837.1 LysR family transcriptional regulator [Vibrio sinaloensis]